MSAAPSMSQMVLTARRGGGFHRICVRCRRPAWRCGVTRAAWLELDLAAERAEQLDVERQIGPTP